MSPNPVKVGIVGLGRWAKVLTRAAMKSDKFEIAVGYSRSQEKRQAYQEEFGIPPAGDMADGGWWAVQADGIQGHPHGCRWRHTGAG